MFTVGIQDRDRFLRTVSVNLLAFVGVLFMGEIALRAIATESLRGPVLAGVELRPYVWSEIAERFTKRKAEEQQKGEFFVFDSLLGWTVKPNTVGEKGLFQSSAEGIRSPRAGIKYAKANPGCRIALVGDSYVFGEESEFEQSWGHQLEVALGNRCQVLNFGVPGYGIGQMYLRYKKDVASFHPDVVIVGFTDAVFRTVGVYGMLTFAPGYIPWPIPRFVLDKQQQLKLINVPLIRPEAIYSARSIMSLPYIRYAWNYEANEWEKPGWQKLSRSYLFRTSVTLFPLWRQPRPELPADEVSRVNAALFKNLLIKIREDRAIPLLVYLPQNSDYQAANFSPSTTLEILRRNRLDHIDLTECLRRVDAGKRFLHGDGHYTPEGELVVAECLTPTVRQYLANADAGNIMLTGSH